LVAFDSHEFRHSDAVFALSKEQKLIVEDYIEKDALNEERKEKPPVGAFDFSEYSPKAQLAYVLAVVLVFAGIVYGIHKKLSHSKPSRRETRMAQKGGKSKTK
jgi:hypothetical protein